MAIFPSWDTPVITPQIDDVLLVADQSDWLKSRQSEVWPVVAAWLPAWTTDLLPEGTTNLYLTPWERVKIASVAVWAQVNSVDSVNWQIGAVILTQDDIWNWTNFVQTENNFTDQSVTDLNTSINHVSSQSNPHNVTKAQVWLGNVTDDLQLSTTAGNFSNLTEKSDIQQHLEDIFVIEDSSDGWNIKKITNQTDLIWKASLIQDWNPSVNYYVFNFTSSTTYDLRSYVYIGGNLYRCLVQHQSSGSFAADLALGYRDQVTWGWSGGWNFLTAGNWAPTTAWVNPWDIYVDLDTWELYYRDWSAWNPIASSWWYTWDVVVFTWAWAPVNNWDTAWDLYVDNSNGDLYYWNWSSRVQINTWSSGGVNYATPTTTGSRIVFSQWTWADTIDESAIVYDDLTGTIDRNGTTQTGNTTFDSSYVANYEWSTINYDSATTQNNSGTVNNDATSVINNQDNSINNTNTTETNVWVTENYDATSVTNNNGNTTNNTNTTTNNNWDTVNNTNSNITNVGVTETYDATSNVTYDNLTVTNLEVTNIWWWTEIIKWVTAAMNGNTINVVDANVLATSVIYRTAQTDPVWFIEVRPSWWSFDINSSAVEAWLIFNYVIIN